MLKSRSANFWSRLVVVSAMTLMLAASASIRQRGFVAAFSSTDFARFNSRSSTHSIQKATITQYGKPNIYKSGASWNRFGSSLQMSTSSPPSPSTETTVLKRVKTVDAKEPTDGNPVLIKGWVRTVRKQKTLAFVEVNDGSNMNGIQCVLSFDSIDEETQEGMVIGFFVDMSLQIFLTIELES